MKKEERDNAIRKLEEFRKDAAEAATRLVFPYSTTIAISEHTNRDETFFCIEAAIFRYPAKEGEETEMPHCFRANWYEWHNYLENLNNLSMCLVKFEAAVDDIVKEQSKKENAA